MVIPRPSSPIADYGRGVLPGIDTDPDRAAAIMHSTGERLTFAELEAHSIQLARALREAGLRTGDHIAMLALNDMRCFEVYWAALRSGLYVTAVNRHLTKDEIAYIVEDCGARVLICSPELAERAPAVEQLLTFDGTYEAFRDAVSAEPLAEQPRGADMLYSSGTTGRPKGIKPPLPDASYRGVRERARRAVPGRLGFRRRHGLSVARPDLPRCAAALRRPSSRRSAARSSSWTASTRPSRCARSSSTRSRTASGCRRCSSAC